MKRSVLFFIIITGISLPTQAQKKGQARIDSLVAVLKTAKEDTNKVNTLNGLGYEFNDANPDTAIYFAKQALSLSEKINFQKGMANAEIVFGVAHVNLGNYDEAMKHLNKVLTYKDDKKNTAKAYHLIGMVYQIKSEYPTALEYYFKSLKIKEASNDKKGMAASYNNIGIVYYNLFNSEKALEYYFKGLKIMEGFDDKRGMAYAYNNIANALKDVKKDIEALEYYFKSLKIKKAINDNNGVASTCTNIGDSYCELFEKDSVIKNKTLSIPGTEVKNLPYSALPDSALSFYLKALAINKVWGNQYSRIYILNGIGRVNRLKQNYKEAIRYFTEAYNIADTLKSNDRQEDAAAGLTLSYRKLNDYKNAFYWQEKYMQHKDSVFNEEKTQELTRSEMNYEFERKEAATKAEQEKKDIQQRNIRNSIAGGLAGALIFLVVVYRQRNKISKEKKRGDELLLNILPAETAEELKNTGATKAKDFSKVTVLFTDFKNFTSLSQKLTAQELVNEINYYYSSFDNIISKYGIEKIKTIGDSYMCAGGLPVANQTNAIDTVAAAIAIREFMEAEKQKKMAAGLPYFEIRIGCNTGPVVAGIVGIKKFAYDIWGDTVNIASRMESSGETGKVNISGSTYELVKDKFSCEYRGEIEAKGKGKVKMYFVTQTIISNG